MIRTKQAACRLVISILWFTPLLAALQDENPIFDRKIKFNTPKQAIPLQSVRVFPNEADENNGVFLGHAQSIAVDTSGLFYIPDDRNDEILVFSESGQFVRRFGRSGQGPGELMRPSGIACGPSGVFVRESQLLRIQQYTFAGKYIGGFRNYKYFNPFLVNKDSIFGAEAHFFPPTSSERDSLIAKLDMDGKVVKRFGATIEAPAADYVNSNKTCIAFTNTNRLAVAFSFFPIFRVYELNGTLIRETRTESGIIDRYAPVNSSALEYLKTGANAPRAYLANALFANADGIYIAIAAPGRIEIILLNEMGERKAYYYKNLAEPLGCNGLIVKNIGDKRHFYILRLYPYHAVEEFVPIKGSR